MGEEGNDFFNVLQWPVLTSFLDLQPDSNIQDIACGNGLTSRRLPEREQTLARSGQCLFMRMKVR
jgi:hypothetical protein